MAKMVGAEDLPPANPAVIPGGIAAEITEIAGAGKIEMTGRAVGHLADLAIRRSNDGRRVGFASCGLYWGNEGENMNIRMIAVFGAAFFSRRDRHIRRARPDLSELSLRRRHAIHRRIFRI